MITQQQLDGLLGKAIAQICPNGFASSTDNHCAHFVSHALALKFGATCSMLGTGKGPAANVRVQEVFARCSKVGAWTANGPGLPMCLVFITNPGNVNLSSRVITNVPRKHMGICTSGFIWHYSNTLHQVVKVTPAQFSNHYAAPDNAMFYGTIA